MLYNLFPTSPRGGLWDCDLLLKTPPRVGVGGKRAAPAAVGSEISDAREGARRDNSHLPLEKRVKLLEVQMAEKDAQLRERTLRLEILEQRLLAIENKMSLERAHCQVAAAAAAEDAPCAARRNLFHSSAVEERQKEVTEVCEADAQEVAAHAGTQAAQEAGARAATDDRQMEISADLFYSFAAWNLIPSFVYRHGESCYIDTQVVEYIMKLFEDYDFVKRKHIAALLISLPGYEVINRIDSVPPSVPIRCVARVQVFVVDWNVWDREVEAVRQTEFFVQFKRSIRPLMKPNVVANGVFNLPGKHYSKLRDSPVDLFPNDLMYLKRDCADNSFERNKFGWIKIVVETAHDKWAIENENWSAVKSTQLPKIRGNLKNCVFVDGGGKVFKKPVDLAKRLRPKTILIREMFRVPHQ